MQDNDFINLPNELEDELWIHEHIHGKGTLNQPKSEDEVWWGRPADDDDEVWLMNNVPGYPRDENKIREAEGMKKVARKKFLESMEGVSGWKVPKEMAKSCGYVPTPPKPETMIDGLQRQARELYGDEFFDD